MRRPRWRIASASGRVIAAADAVRRPRRVGDLDICGVIADPVPLGGSAEARESFCPDVKIGGPPMYPIRLCP